MAYGQTLYDHTCMTYEVWWCWAMCHTFNMSHHTHDNVYDSVSCQCMIIQNLSYSCDPSSYPHSPNFCVYTMVDCVYKPRIFIQCSCLIASRRGYESALWRTRMLLPNAGRKIADWLLCGFIQCTNIHVLARSLTASVQKFGGCGYDDAYDHTMLDCVS